MADFFASNAWQEILKVFLDMKNGFVPGIWETLYSTVLSTLFANVIGLPLGVLLVTGERNGIHPLPAGLMKAINNFDLSKEVRFSTYCVPMISGELRRYLRDFNQIKVSRSLRDLAYQVMQAKEQLTTQLQKEPTLTQIAEKTGAKQEDIVIAMESISEPMSLYEPVYSDTGDTLYILDQISDQDTVENWMGELSLREAIRKLGKREQNILYLRFFQGKTQTEVAKEIGISQAQISRLEKGAITKIREASKI